MRQFDAHCACNGQSRPSFAGPEALWRGGAKERGGMETVECLDSRCKSCVRRRPVLQSFPCLSKPSLRAVAKEFQRLRPDPKLPRRRDSPHIAAPQCCTAAEVVYRAPTIGN